MDLRPWAVRVRVRESHGMGCRESWCSRGRWRERLQRTLERAFDVPGHGSTHAANLSWTSIAMRDSGRTDAFKNGTLAGHDTWAKTQRHALCSRRSRARYAVYERDTSATIMHHHSGAREMCVGCRVVEHVRCARTNARNFAILGANARNPRAGANARNFSALQIHTTPPCTSLGSLVRWVLAVSHLRPRSPELLSEKGVVQPYRKL